MHTKIKKQTLTNILTEFEINRQGRLLFRTAVKSFFKGQTDKLTNRWPDRRTDRLTSRVMKKSILFSEEKFNAKNLNQILENEFSSNFNTFFNMTILLGIPNYRIEDLV